MCFSPNMFLGFNMVLFFLGFCVMNCLRKVKKCVSIFDEIVE